MSFQLSKVFRQQKICASLCVSMRNLQIYHRKKKLKKRFMELNFCVFHLQQSTICLEMNLRISTVVVELFVSYVNFFLRLTKSSHFIFSSFSSSFWFPLFLTKSEWLYEYVLEKLEENRQLPMDFQSFMVKNRNWHWHMWFVCWSAPHTHKHAHLGCFVKMRLFYLLVNTFRLCICMHTNESSLFTCFLLLPFISSHYYICLLC